ncbi:MAG: PAS domain S-box protein [Azospirillaceae bacterium]
MAGTTAGARAAATAPLAAPAEDIVRIATALAGAPAALLARGMETADGTPRWQVLAGPETAVAACLAGAFPDPALAAAEGPVILPDIRPVSDGAALGLPVRAGGEDGPVTGLLAILGIAPRLIEGPAGPALDTLVRQAAAVVAATPPADTAREAGPGAGGPSGEPFSGDPQSGSTASGSTATDGLAAEIAAAGRALFSDGPGMMALLDADGHVRAANARLLAFGGVALDRVTGRAVWDAPWARGSRAARTRLARAVRRARQGIPVAHRETVRGPAGALRIVEMALTPVPGPHGRVERMVFEARDATGADGARGDIGRLFMLSPDPMAVLDADGALRQVNPAFLTVLGVDPERVPELSLLDVIAPEDRQAAIETLASLARGRTATHFLTRCRTAGDQSAWMTWSLSASGERLYAVGHDMTARIEAEQALVERDLQLGLIAENLPGAMYRLLDRQDGHEEVLYISEGETELSGWHPEELMARPEILRESIHEADRDAVGRAFEDAARRGGTADVVYRIVTRDGRVVWIRDIARARPLADGAVMWDGVSLDITAWKAAEQGLQRAKEEAEQANRAKSEFLANMSHELRTPLNAILGFSDLMLSGTFGPLGSPRYEDYVRDIHDSGSHLLALIGDILDMAKVEAGKYQLLERDCDLARLIPDTVRQFRPLAGDDGPVLAADLAADLPAVRADERLLRQILNNLVSNAVKFTEKGSVTVGAARNGEGGVRLTVADTGIGMSRHDVARAFQPFGQVESAMSRRNQGTGLGLTLVQSFVELHGGTITVDTRKGQGTRIMVDLPAERVVADAAPRIGSGPAPCAPGPGGSADGAMDAAGDADGGD